ncbi:uncharacterized protein LOC129579734 [Sitodiplosis mosellana]|uniref:uncharacterized protein LOC129579734 n=1 Tax=Sitodiplosis mosellana TaxID=263140 RepID=UPI0024445072|nr:uncharacterized protein LOC129579734 [Sitodiplosis mosellana]
MVHRATPMPSLPTAEYLKKTNNLDKSYNDRLKQVFVTSVDDNTNLDLTKGRSMPKDRTTPFTKSPHSQTTDQPQPNKLIVDEIKVILLNHKTNPDKWTPDYIAARYNISTEIAGILVENYGTLQTYFGGQPNESDKYIHHEEPVRRVTANTHFYEMEEIVTGGRKEKKWKTKEEFDKEWMGKK